MIWAKKKPPDPRWVGGNGVDPDVSPLLETA
jgi:hypothetical protein